MPIEDGYIKISIQWVKVVVIALLKAIVFLSVLIFGMSFFNAMPTSSSKLLTSDAIAVANTFTVFVTFIFVVFTVAITLAGINFSRWWSRERKKVLSDNWSEMLETIKNDDKLMRALKEGLLNESLEDMMKENIQKHKKEIDDDVSAKLRKMEIYVTDSLRDKGLPSIGQEQIKDMSESLKG